MKKKYVVLNLILIGLVIIVVFGCKKEENDKDLTASGHPAWWPIMHEKDGQIVGAAPEIVKKILTEIGGINATTPYVGAWDVVQQKAQTGEIDIIVAAYKTAAREKYMNYSIPYTLDPISIIVKKGNAFPYDEWGDLIGKNGVLMVGDSYGQDFDTFIEANLTTVRVATPAEAFALLNNGEADYFIYALYSAEHYIKENNISNEVEIIPKYVTAENFYLTISKKSSFVNLMPQINAILERYKNDGTIDEIIEKNKIK